LRASWVDENATWIFGELILLNSIIGSSEIKIQIQTNLNSRFFLSLKKVLAMPIWQLNSNYIS
jgi:hypothetical protein